MSAAYAVRGAVLQNQLNMGAALADLEKADSLPGNDAETLRLFAQLLGQHMRHDEALRMADRAMSLDPLNPISLETKAFVLYRARRYTEAAEEARSALEISPGRQQSRRVLANALLWLNRYGEAAAEYQKLEPDDYRRVLGEAVLAIRAGNRGSAMAHLESMRKRYGDGALYQYAEIYAQLGEADQAIDQLQAALAARDQGLAGIRIDPFLDPVRRDPRFAALEAKLSK